MSRWFFLISAILLVSACATTEPLTLVPGAQSVRVGKADPPKGYIMVGPISAASGDGCGGFGRNGSYVNAVTRLRNVAALMGANYVEIYTLSPPHMEGMCLSDAYVITGMAYKSP